MTRLSALAPLFAALAMVQPASAAPPPADAMPLSEIVRALEGASDFGYIDDIDWDDDDGHWEIEYYRTDGTEVEVDVDPVSGEPRR